MAASGRDLVDVFPLQHCHHGGLSDVVGVSKTKLDDREQKQHGPISGLSPRLQNEFIIYLRTLSVNVAAKTEDRMLLMRVNCH